MGHLKAGVFFLSTGRCGTQWLQGALSATYPDEAVVTHEPIRGAYEPKLYLRAYDKVDELLSSDEVARHVSFIRGTLRTRTYIETGWPCYAAIPLMIDQLHGRVRIVHLVRHPVHVALSLATHRVYERQDWIAGAALSPFDQGVVQKGLAGDWADMGMYERCLFWWTEINLYALELRERYPGVEFTVVRFEDIFDREKRALESAIRFMDLSYTPSIERFRSENADRYHLKSPAVDWKLIFKYPQTVALAKHFGYEPDDVTTPQIAQRYFNSGEVPPSGRWRGIKRAIRKLGRRTE